SMVGNWTVGCQIHASTRAHPSSKSKRRNDDDATAQPSHSKLISCNRIYSRLQFWTANRPRRSSLCRFANECFPLLCCLLVYHLIFLLGLFVLPNFCDLSHSFCLYILVLSFFSRAHLCAL